MAIFIYGIFQISWHVILCYLFLEIFAEKATLTKFKKYGLEIGLIVGNYLLAFFLAEEFFWKQLMIIILTSVIMRFLFQQKYKKILILTLLYQAGCMVIEYMVLVIIEKGFVSFTKEMMESSVVSSLVGILCQMVAFCLILMMKKHFVKNVSSSLTELEWVRFSVFSLFTIIVLVALIMNFGVIQTERQGNLLVYIACGLLIINVMFFYLINDIMKREQQITEYRLFQQKIKNQTESYRSISEGYEEQRKKVHEFTNKMSCIMALAQGGEYEKLKSYLVGMRMEMLEQDDCIDTNNILVNAILNSKYQEAKNKGITFVIKINDLSNIKLLDEDIVLLLYNLLNNAFEACEKCEEKIVRFKFVQEQDAIILSVINTCKYTPVKDGDKFQTSKKTDVKSHGVGIENIKEVVEKNKGTCVIKYEEPMFKFIIMIPNEKEVP